MERLRDVGMAVSHQTEQQWIAWKPGTTQIHRLSLLTAIDKDVHLTIPSLFSLAGVKYVGEHCAKGQK